MVRCVEREFHESRNRVPSFLLSVAMEISKDCVMVMTSVWLHEKILEERFEVKQTGHSGFGVNDEKELKILNRTIKIDVLNDEMTLESDTKLVENALESMKLNGAKGVDSRRVRRNEEQTAQIENSEKLTSVESTLYHSLVMQIGVCCSRKS